MKNIIAVVGITILVCSVNALAWPYGNVGLNVDEPEAQLDVGGDVIVRSNLTVRNNGNIIMTNDGADGGGKILFDVSYVHGEGITHNVAGVEEGIAIELNAEFGVPTKTYTFRHDGILDGLNFAPDKHAGIKFTDPYTQQGWTLYAVTNPPSLKLIIGTNTYTFTPDN